MHLKNKSLRENSQIVKLPKEMFFNSKKIAFESANKQFFKSSLTMKFYDLLYKSLISSSKSLFHFLYA